jgi:hypothetical protein
VIRETLESVAALLCVSVTCVANASLYRCVRWRVSVSRLSIHRLLIWFAALSLMSTAGPTAGQASSIMFDFAVDGSNGKLGGLGSFGRITADDTGGQLRIEATLDLVAPFEYEKPPVQATFGFGLVGGPSISVNILTPNFARLGPNPAVGIQSNDTGDQLSLDATLDLAAPYEYGKPPVNATFGYGIVCLLQSCGRELNFIITHIGSSNNPIYDLTIASLKPVLYSVNNDKYSIYFAAFFINSSTGASGSVGATSLRNELPSVPIPGAAWLMGTVLAACYAFGVRRRGHSH